MINERSSGPYVFFSATYTISKHPSCNVLVFKYGAYKSTVLQKHYFISLFPPGYTYAPGLIPYQVPTLQPGFTFPPGKVPTPAPGYTYAPNMIPTPAPGFTYAPGLLPTFAPGKIPTPAPGKTFAPNMVPFPTFAPGNIMFNRDLSQFIKTWDGCILINALNIIFNAFIP